LINRAAVLTLLLCFAAFLGYAQKPLCNSRQSSYYTYIYKLKPEDVLKFYKNPGKAPDQNILHQPVDSFKTDKEILWINRLPAGNYLEVHAEKNKLNYELVENHSAWLKLIQNDHDLRFALFDHQGKSIKDAQVLVNDKKLAYDERIGLFKTAYSKKDTIVRVEYGSVTNFFLTKPITRHYYYDRPGWLKTLWLSIKGKDAYGNDKKSYYRREVNSKYTGFLVFSKPKYKPGDTVKFKAFILKSKSKKPIAASRLLVRLKRDYDDNGKILGYINSYRPGGYEYSFVLSDSLKLQLDDQYSINLEDPSSAKYDLDRYKGDLDDEEYLAKRKVYSSGKFRYEDYELKSIHFDMSTDKDEHSPGDKLAVYLKASDENDLPVPDGRARLVLTTQQVSAYKGPGMFIPDTLWTHQVNLEPLGETKVIIPDSIFPRADIRYYISADFLNSSNEHQSAFKYEFYKADKFKIDLSLNRDTLSAQCLENGKPIKVPATLSALNAKEDTISQMKVMLPCKTTFNPDAASYDVETDSAYSNIELKRHDNGISLSGYRTADSLFVTIKNERKLHFWYSVFAGSKLIDDGQADSLFYKRSYTWPANATFTVNYVWAGESKKEQTTLGYAANALNINVKQPIAVYPGQRVQTDIVVTDVKGDPVANADVTAWSFTRKFTGFNTPFVPYLGKTYLNQKTKKPFNIVQVTDDGSIPLNWLRWSREIGLDSIEYYKFTHPATAYRIEEPENDTITQIAPFIVKKGDVVPVHILYIDNRPVYFSQAEQMQRYSFAVLPGKHSLRFRTIDENITLDSVMVEKSRKLILSLNENAPADKFTSFQKVSDTLNHYEAELINNYMITVVNNFGWKMAYLQHGENLILLNPSVLPSYSSPNILTGPLAVNYAAFKLRGEKSTRFITEPGYSYLFEPGLIRQKSLPTKYPFSRNLLDIKGTDDYTQYALTRTAADSIWQQYLDLRSSSEQLFINPPVTGKQTGRLNIGFPDTPRKPLLFIKNIIIYRYDNPDYIRIYPGNSTEFGNLEPGKYRLLFLLKGDSYDIADSVNVKPYGINYYKLNVRPTHSKDGVSTKINDIINSRPGQYSSSDGDIENDALRLKEAFNEKYYNAGNFSSVISGTVIAKDDGLPIPGVTVKIKGTSIGVQTGTNGKFSLQVPSRGALVFSFIGYQTAEVNIYPDEVIKIALAPTSQQLGEVVVTGALGIKSQARQLGYATALLQSQASGVIVVSNGAPGSASKVYIRGLGNFQNKTPLYIVDGVQVSDLSSIDPNDVGSISVLKNAAASAIYGITGGNGVVIITTKQKVAALQAAAEASGSQQNPEQAIRKNFSDYAYWQPKLTTDENGIARFTTTFPDDITNWRTFFTAINGQKQSGFIEHSIKSFKPLSAALISPQFAVQGDSLSAIGKVTNYNTDPVKVTRSFIYNGKLFKQDVFDVKNAKIDTLNVIATNADSLTFEYSIKRDNGYFDGEQRKIPVFEQGVIETKGVFEALNKDTTVLMKFDPALGPVTFRAEASVLPALAEEAQHLREYKYLCNEQLASKLKGLLAERRIRTFLGEPFKYGKNILEVIKKLQENRRSQGTWGWWKDTDEELWISLHAVEALTDAQKEGYTIDIDLPKLIEYLVYQLESYRGEDKLACLRLLFKLNAKVDYPKYFGVISKELAAEKEAPEYDKFSLLLLQEQGGTPVKLDSLFAREKHTLLGNIYWGEDNYRFFDNSVQVTLLAYKILKIEGKHPELLEKIRGYLLEQRRSGEWRNTYESSLVLETLLPELLKESKLVKPVSITITGSKTETVTSFPFDTKLNDNQLTVSKTGSLPVYITGYQQFWNPRPEKVNKDFSVDTWFEKKGDKPKKLTAGEAVTLKAEVIVKGDADFVMIEIPIPAGCSYEDKEQSWQNNEVHREFFKDKVSIFCRKLKQGKYEFSIQLMPRFDGVYNLNPAKAEMMYFPVFYGREGMKKVVIGSMVH